MGAIDIHIRDMMLKDVEEVHILGTSSKEFSIIESECFWPIKTLEDWISSSNIALVACNYGTLAGFGLATYNSTTRVGTFENVVVWEPYRGKKAGQKLAQAIDDKLQEKGAKFIRIMTEIENKPMQNLLKKQGYRQGKEYYWMHKDL